MKRKRILVAFLLLTLAALACNPPGTEPTSGPPPTVTPFVPPAGETVPPPTQPPEEPTSTSAPEEPTETIPLATTTPTATTTAEPPQPTVPSSEGPLDFSIPSSLNDYQPTGEGDYEVTLVIHITGGAPPFTVHHDLDTFETDERDYAIVWRRSGCSAINHTITVESADGQSATHDYWIPVPWCD
ncbi:MAG: hypothetical protein PVI59_07250 [Anaerolineae bacterium]|jgi:hypothetical protein